MSDPSSGFDVYLCCSEPMRGIRLPKILTADVLFFCCYSCGVVRHRWPRGDPRRDAAEKVAPNYASMLMMARGAAGITGKSNGEIR